MHKKINPEISIIIVNFNTVKYLIDCLYSIFENNNDVNAEVIVIDNCSTDGTIDRIQTFFPVVHTISLQKNVGFAAANNQGIRIAKAPLILILNPDTYLPSGSLRSCIKKIQSDNKIGLLTPKLIMKNGTLDWACHRSFPTALDMCIRIWGIDRIFPKNKLIHHYSLSYIDPNVQTEVECISGAFMLTRKEAVNEVGNLDEQFFMYFEDIDWSYRFKLKGWKIIYYPDISILHYKRRCTRRYAFSILYYYNSLYLGFRKYYRSEYPIIINLLMCLIIYIKMLFSLVFISGKIIAQYFVKYIWQQHKKLPLYIFQDKWVIIKNF